jgi:CheY-like chemotaxis protein
VAAIQTVLVVEDSADIAALEAEVIVSGGRRAIIAADGVEALTVLMHTSVDLILLDLNLPQMDGRGLLKLLGARTSWRQIPVLVVSANLSGFRATPQVVGVVAKPFEMSEFVDAIDRALSASRTAGVDPGNADPAG